MDGGQNGAVSIESYLSKGLNLNARVPSSRLFYTSYEERSVITTPSIFVPNKKK